MKNLLKIIACTLVPFFAASFAQAANTQEADLSSLYEHVLLKNAAASEAACQRFADTLQTLQADASNDAIKQPFTDLVTSWKKVEANYIGAEINTAAIDWPHYLDIFRLGNEDLHKQIKRALASDSKPEIALFKNSFRTINALEILLFADDKLSARELLLAGTVSANICRRLHDIHQLYQDKRAEFLADSGKALAILTHALATSSFKLKDWRVGDVAGLTNKYAARGADIQRSEYALSGNSVLAIEAILSAQEELIGQQDYANFVDIAKLYQAEKQIERSQKLLQQAQQQTAELKQADFDFATEKTRPLYQTLGKLHDSYYAGLLQALPVLGRILEADGD